MNKKVNDLLLTRTDKKPCWTDNSVHFQSAENDKIFSNTAHL